MIGFVNGASAGNPNIEVTTQPLTIPATGVGNDLFIQVTTGNEPGHGNPAVVVTAVAVTGGPAATFKLLAAITNDKMREEVWGAGARLSGVALPSGITEVTITPASSTSIEVASYQAIGVRSLGQIVTGSSLGGTTDSVSIPTQDPNNVVVAFFGKEAHQTGVYLSVTSGIGRVINGINGAINTDCVAYIVDNTSVAPASVTCAVSDDGTVAPIERTRIAIELRTVGFTLPGQGGM